MKNEGTLYRKAQSRKVLVFLGPIIPFLPREIYHIRGDKRRSE